MNAQATELNAPHWVRELVASAWLHGIALDSLSVKSWDEFCSRVLDVQANPYTVDELQRLVALDEITLSTPKGTIKAVRSK